PQIGLAAAGVPGRGRRSRRGRPRRRNDRAEGGDQHGRQQNEDDAPTGVGAPARQSNARLTHRSLAPCEDYRHHVSSAWTDVWRTENHRSLYATGVESVNGKHSPDARQVRTLTRFAGGEYDARAMSSKTEVAVRC